MHNLVFPELEVVKDPNDKYMIQKKTSEAVSRLNKQLKKITPAIGIEKKVSMHIARHTFGNISGDKIPVQMLQKLYRHSHISTTINYQSNFIFRDTDEALEKVIGS
jgi:site-specific recombinase XerD